MDIILLNPYYSQLAKYYSFYRPTAPLGLMYLAGYLRKHGLPSKIHELGIFDIVDALKIGRRVRFGVSDEAIIKIILADRPKIIGITCMYSIYYRDVVEIADTIKRADPSVKVIIGGNHASSYWKYVLKHKSIDYVVIGEGEETFLELARNILDGNPARHIQGLAFREGDEKTTATPPRPLKKDLDDIPFPARDLINFRRYAGENNPFVMRHPTASIITSRGCPCHCVYCTIQAVWGRSWRGRSSVNVVDEMEFLVKEYGIREFSILDDSASVDKKRWEAICDEIIGRKLNIRWTTPNGIAHWTLTKDLVSKMKKAGCYRLTFGIESGNLETRKFLGKPYSLSQAREILRHANLIGMWTICTNIIGFPYENKQSIRDTIEFAKTCGTDFACFYLLIPQPTSEVYDYFKKEKLLDFDSFFKSEKFDEEEFERVNYVLNETGCDTLHFKKEELNRLQKNAYRSFILHRGLSYLFNPLKLVRKIHSLEDLGYVLRLGGKGVEIFLRTLNPLNKKSSDYLYADTKAEIA